MLFMDRVIGEAEEQAVSYAVQGTVCSCSFSVAKCCCFTPSFLLRQSFCHAVSEGWRGHKPFIISDPSEDLSFILLSTSFGEGCNSGSSDPCRVTLVRDGPRRRTMGAVALVGFSLLVQNFTRSTSGDIRRGGDVGEDHGFCLPYFTSYEWCEKLKRAGQSCNFWVGFVYRLTRERDHSFPPFLPL